MIPDNKLKFAIKLNDNVMRCVIIPDGEDYKVELNDVEVAVMRPRQQDKWMVMDGYELPREFIEELDLHIEARYKEREFPDHL